MLVETPSFSMHHLKTDAFSMPHLHCHSFYEIYFSQTDDLRVIVNNHQYTLQKNDVMVYHRDDLHRAIPKEGQPYERCMLFFDPNAIAHLTAGQENLLSCFENRSAFFSHKVHLTDDEAKALSALFHATPSTRYPILWSQSILCQILVLVNEKFTSMLSETTCVAEERSFGKVQLAVDYINANIAADLSLDALAARCFMEKSYFCKVFKEATGFTAHDYICYKRVVLAEQMLAEGDSVLNVSQRVGYQSSAHFSTKFKEYWGFSPKMAKKYRTAHGMHMMR